MQVRHGTVFRPEADPKKNLLHVLLFSLDQLSSSSATSRASTSSSLLCHESLFNRGPYRFGCSFIASSTGLFLPREHADAKQIYLCFQKSDDDWVGYFGTARVTIAPPAAIN